MRLPTSVWCSSGRLYRAPHRPAARHGRAHASSDGQTTPRLTPTGVSSTPARVLYRLFTAISTAVDGSSTREAALPSATVSPCGPCWSNPSGSDAGDDQPPRRRPGKRGDALPALVPRRREQDDLARLGSLCVAGTVDAGLSPGGGEHLAQLGGGGLGAGGVPRPEDDGVAAAGQPQGQGVARRAGTAEDGDGVAHVVLPPVMAPLDTAPFRTVQVSRPCRRPSRSAPPPSTACWTWARVRSS